MDAICCFLVSEADLSHDSATPSPVTTGVAPFPCRKCTAHNVKRLLGFKSQVTANPFYTDRTRQKSPTCTKVVFTLTSFSLHLAKTHRLRRHQQQQQQQQHSPCPLPKPLPTSSRHRKSPPRPKLVSLLAKVTRSPSYGPCPGT